MKKFVYALFVATFLVLLFGCKNFMEGGELSKSLSEAIDYANATLCPVTITPANEGEGSTDPSGKTNAKIGYETAIKFRQSDDYQFVRWETNSDKITFLDETDPETYFTLAEGAENLKVTAYSVRRMEMIGQPAPIYTQNGVSRDRDITVTFSMNPSMENFIFKLEEIDQIKKDNPCCEVVEIKNEAGQIYAYKVYKNGYWQSYFKNISITSSNGNDSEVEHFQQPKIEDKRLIIETDRTNPIAIKGEQKDLKVVINATIFNEPVTEKTSPDYYPYSFPMNKTISWEYRVTKQTDEKAFITIKAQKSEMGDVYPPNVMNESFNMDQTIGLDFTEDSAYQFVRWDYDSSILSISNPLSRQTTAKVINKNAQENGTEVIAVCKPKLKIISFKPVIDDDVTSVPKNSQILIKFDHPLPDENDEKFKQQLDDILISSNGIDITDSFGTPKIIDNDTVVFDADKQNMIEVKDNEIKNITVTIPSTFYYIAEDTDGSPIKVSIGGNGKSFNYKINNTTVHKTNVKYNLDVSIASGSLINNVTKQQTYATGTQDTFIFNDGETVELNFIPSKSESEITEYKIKGWKVECDDTTKNDFTVTSQDIENKGSIEVKKDDETYFELLIDENNPSKAYAISYKAMGTDSNDGTHLKISVYQYLVPKISDYSPKYIKEGVECDTPIVIDFTKEINKNSIIIYDEATHQGTLKLVSNSNPDIHYEDYIENITWSNSNRKLTIMLNANINKEFENDETLYLDVILDGSKIIDSDGKYLEGTEKWSYRINKNTTVKTKIKFFESLDETGYSVTVNGVYDVGAEVGYSLNQTISIECVPRAPSEYRLTDWNIPDAYKDYISVENTNSSKTTLTIKKISPDTLNINPIVLQMPVVLDEFTKPSYVSQGVNMDTPIEFKFNREIDSSTISLYNAVEKTGSIQIISSSGEHIEQYFKTPNLSIDGKDLTIQSNGTIINNLIPEGTKLIFTVILTEKIKDTEERAFIQSEKEFCFNSARDTYTPSLIGFSLYLNEKSSVPFFDENDAVTKQENHIKDSVYIKDFKAFDEGSGIKGIVVEETLIQKEDGTQCNIKAYKNPYEPEPEIIGVGIIKEDEDDRNNYIGSCTYNLLSTEDGIVKLVFRGINYADAVTEQSYTYYVVKDTKVVINNYYLTNYSDTIKNYLSGGYRGQKDYSGIEFTLHEVTSNNFTFYVEKDNWGYGCSSDVTVNFSLVDENGDEISDVSHTKSSSEKYQITFNDTQSEAIDKNQMYLKVVLTDAVGNKKVENYLIPTNIVERCIHPGNFIDLTLKNHVEAENEISYTNYIFKGGGKESSKIQNYQIIDRDIKKHKFYSINDLKVTNVDYFIVCAMTEYSYSSPAGDIITLYGKPYKLDDSLSLSEKKYFFKKGDCISDKYLASISIDSDSVSVKPDKNINKYKVIIEIDDKEEYNDYLFYIINGSKMVDPSLTSVIFSEASEVQVNNGTRELVFYTEANPYTNTDTNTYEFYIKLFGTKDGSDGLISSTQIVSCEEKDVLPPDPDLDALLYFSDDGNNLLFVRSAFADKGIKYGFDDNQDIPYWFIPFKEEWDYMSPKNWLSKDELPNIDNALHTNYSNVIGSGLNAIMKFPVQEIYGFGRYALIAKVTDAAGNYYWNGISSFTVGKQSSAVTWNVSGSTVNVTTTLQDAEAYPKRVFMYKKFKGGSWVDGSPVSLYIPENENIFSLSSSQTLEENTFHKLYIVSFGDRTVRSNEKEYFSSVIYSAPKYVYSSASAVTCNTKSVSYRNSIMVNVSYDQPCIVETYSCKENFANEEDWEILAKRASSELLTPTGNDTAASSVYYLDTSKAEYGDYYRVVVHFADGTTKMTEVRQK